MSQLSKNILCILLPFVLMLFWVKKKKAWEKRPKALKPQATTSHRGATATTSKRQGPAGKDVKKIKNSRQEKPLRLFLGLLGRWGSFSSFIFFEIVFLKFQFKKWM